MPIIKKNSRVFKNTGLDYPICVFPEDDFEIEENLDNIPPKGGVLAVMRGDRMILGIFGEPKPICILMDGSILGWVDKIHFAL